jgi:hypothetical protein
VRIDLDALEAATGLKAESARVLAFRAALALQRRHRPGVVLSCDVAGKLSEEELHWAERPPDSELHEDFNRVTEEGAEAIALALAGHNRKWRVLRRLQSRASDGVDWLLTDSTTNTRVILEVSGTDEGSLGSVLKAKINQAKNSDWADQCKPAACVVRFKDPRVSFWVDDGNS